MHDQLLAAIPMDPHILWVQLGSALVLPKVQQLFKDRPWAAWLDNHTDFRNRATAVVGALMSVGFAFAFDGTLEAGGKLTITIPAWNDIAAALPMLGMQYYATKGMYHAWTKPPLLPPQEPPRS